MAIKTTIAPMYGGQKLFAGVLFLVLGLWGLYDYAVKIPAQEKHHAEFTELTTKLKEFEGRELTGAEQQEVVVAIDRLNVLAPGGVAPIKPSKFNRATQWAYMTCIPFAPWFFWLFVKAKRQKYELDDQGTLHFAGDPELKSGQWTKEEITDIDMSRWMAKSIAYPVHADGRRLKLDAYIYKNLHLIVGAIASRFYPELWDPEARKVKSNQPAADQASGGTIDDQAVQQNAAS